MRAAKGKALVTAMCDRLDARAVENRNAKATAMFPFEIDHPVSQCSVPISGSSPQAHQSWPGKQRAGQKFSA